MKQLADVFLEKVRVAHINTAQKEVHYERGEQQARAVRIFPDDLKPYADIGEVCRIDFNLPVLADSTQLRSLEPHLDDVLQEEIDQDLIFRIDHFESDGPDDLQGRLGIALKAPVKNFEYPRQEPL